MKLLVFGATGRCGSATVQRALAAGYDVACFVRSEDKARGQPWGSHERVTIVLGNTRSADDVRSAVLKHGQGAVLSGLSSFEPPFDHMSTLTAHVIEAGRSSQQKLRYMVYGLHGVSSTTSTWASGVIFGLVSMLSPWKFGPAIQDHKRQLALLDGCGLNCTVFQTLTMVDRPIGRPFASGSPSACPGVRLWQQIGYLDAAECVLQNLGADDLPELQMKYR